MAAGAHALGCAELHQAVAPLHNHAQLMGAAVRRGRSACHYGLCGANTACVLACSGVSVLVAGQALDGGYGELSNARRSMQDR